MAKFQNATKRNVWGSKVYAAPAEWVTLLRQAVDEPGVISAAYRMFYSYSVGNQLMALYQLTSRGIALGPLASYGRWQEMGRQVRKGESAVVMLVPSVRKSNIENQDGEVEEQKQMYFRFAPTAFALGQTDPIEGQADRSAEALPEMPDWSSTRALSALGVALAPFESVSGSKMGYFQPQTRTIHINPMNPHKDKTILHEMAHSIMHKNGYEDSDDRGTAEFEAEAVALIIGTVLGFGGADESRGYCQKWLARAGHDDINERSASKILAACQKILTAGRPSAVRKGEREAVAA